MVNPGLWKPAYIWYQAFNTIPHIFRHKAVDLNKRSMADPGFPKGVASPKSGGANLLFWPVVHNNYMNMKILDLEGCTFLVQVPHYNPLPSGSANGDDSVW